MMNIYLEDLVKSLTAVLNGDKVLTIKQGYHDAIKIRFTDNRRG